MCINKCFLWCRLCDDSIKFIDAVRWVVPSVGVAHSIRAVHTYTHFAAIYIVQRASTREDEFGGSFFVLPFDARHSKIDDETVQRE